MTHSLFHDSVPIPSHSLRVMTPSQTTHITHSALPPLGVLDPQPFLSLSLSLYHAFPPSPSFHSTPPPCLLPIPFVPPLTTKRSPDIALPQLPNYSLLLIVCSRSRHTPRKPKRPILLLHPREAVGPGSDPFRQIFIKCAHRPSHPILQLKLFGHVLCSFFGLQPQIQKLIKNTNRRRGMQPP